MLGRHKKTRVCLEKGSVCLSEEKLGSQNHFSTPKKTKKQQQQKRVVKLCILKLENEDKLKNIKLQKYDFKAGTTIIPGKVYTYNSLSSMQKSTSQELRKSGFILAS